jgi:tetratricopeptide (TPR) repeat protein
MNTEATPGKNIFAANRELIVALILAAIVVVIYAQSRHFGFVDLDDNEYVYRNPVIIRGLNWETVKWAFTTFHAANWHPLTWLSHATDISLFGLNPGRHHVVNLLFHAANSILVLVVFSRLTGRFWESGAVAALFAAHPAHVESVAWVAERKDVLSTLFWLLTMWAYWRYLQPSKPKEPAEAPPKPGKGKKPVVVEPNLIDATIARWQSLRFWLIVLFFVLGLMSKPMLVTLPFVLLLCDFWPLRRLRSSKDILPLVLEKAPLFLLVIASSLVTMAAQRAGGAVQGLAGLPLSTRVLNSIQSYADYVGMLFYPAKLTVMYPYPDSFIWWRIALALLTLAAITALCWWQRSSRRYLLMGWLWFVGTMVPVIGLVQVGAQSMADRYTYVPYLGLFVMIVWGVADLCRALRLNQQIAYALLIAAVMALAFLSFRQTRNWRDDETSYLHSLAVTKRNFMISYNLCHLWMIRDRLDEAEPLCRDAIEFKPQYVESYNTLGVIDMRREHFAEAEKYFQETVRRRPDYGMAFANLAQSQIMLGRPEDAEDNLKTAVQLTAAYVPPGNWAPYLGDLAAAYVRQKNDAKVVENLQRLVYLQPTNVAARKLMARSLYNLQRYPEASEQLRQALTANQNDADAHNLNGLVLLAEGQKQAATDEFETAIKLEPNFVEAKQNLTKARGGQ